VRNDETAKEHEMTEIESRSDGAVCFVGGFNTPNDARVWIDDYLQVIGQAKATLIDETLPRLSDFPLRANLKLRHCDGTGSAW
jgi:hypothetical protein